MHPTNNKHNIIYLAELTVEKKGNYNKTIDDFHIWSNHFTYANNYIFPKATTILLSPRLLTNQTYIEAILTDFYWLWANSSMKLDQITV